MTAGVVNFTGNSTLDLPCDRVLQEALDAGMTEVVICGFDADGVEYFASSCADAGDAGYHLDRAKWRIMTTLDRMAEAMA